MKKSDIKTLDQTREIKKTTLSKSDNTKKKKRSPHFKTRILASVLATIASIGVIGVFIVSMFVVAAVKESPTVNIDLFERGDSTIILDANDEIIYDTGDKLVENITYEDIPQSLVDAFLAIEDSRFFEHNGFDLPRFSMAMLNNVKDTLTSGSLSFDGGGASTLDMQLVRNSVFMKENVETGETELPASSGIAGIKRKIQEIYIATAISRDNILSKRTVFQMYVNRINFGTGNNILGVQKSAEYYFNKDVEELTLVESAFLAGVINSPSFYTPYYRLSNAKDRTDLVLYYMKYHGYITDDEYQRALSVPLENLFADRSKDSTSFDYQAYIDIVYEEVKELTGLNPNTTPMVIKTSMNKKLQAQLDSVQRREIASLNYDSTSKLQMSSTIINNATGEVLAVVGGYDYNNRLAFNRATDGDVQPGSSVKPVVDYAPAFEYLGWATSHVLSDEPYYYGGTNTKLNNWDNRYEGQLTLRRAISDSRNVPAIETFDAVKDVIGNDKYIEYMRSLGFKMFDESKFNSQFSIGGSAFSTTTYELAGAYAAVMNSGVYNTPHTVRQIDFKDGTASITSPYSSNQVMSDAAAYMTAKTMRDVIIDNLTYTARPTRRSYPVYAKTGTTNYDAAEAARAGAPVGSSKDLLMVNATDQYTIASWTGFDQVARVPENKPWLSSKELSFNLTGRLNSYILDCLEEQFGQGKEISKPSSVADITHIAGPFPYQSPIAGMNSELVTTGLIKKDRLTLVQAEAPDVEALKDLTVSTSGSGLNFKVNAVLSPYPDLSKLTVATKSYEMSDRNGVKYTGSRIYDPSWIYGAIRYQAELHVNGTVVDTVKSDSENISFTLPSNTTGSIQVCGYYTFDLNQDKRSESICKSVDTSNATVTVPNFSSINELSAFANEYDITLHTSNVANSNLSQFGTIRSLSPDNRGKSVTVSSIRGKSWSVGINDYIVDSSQYVNKSYNTFNNAFKNYFTIEKDGSGSTVVGIFAENGAQLTSFSIFDFLGQTITVKVN